MAITKIKCKQQRRVINYQVFYYCNYNCSFCTQNKFRNIYNDKIDTNLIKDISIQINKLIENFDDNLPVTLYLEGGEISLLDIEKYILPYFTAKKIDTLKIVTNLSADLSYYQSLQSYCNNHNWNFRLLASLHLTECEDVNNFIKKADILKPHILIVVDNNNYLSYEPYIKYFLENKFSYTINAKRYNQKITQNVLNFINKYNSLKEFKTPYIIYYDNGKITENDLNDRFDLSYYFKNNQYYCDSLKDFIIRSNGNINNIGSCYLQLTSKYNILNLNDDEIKDLGKQKYRICPNPKSCYAFRCSYCNLYRKGEEVE